jgi:signal transduction histidine kinase
LAHPVPGAFTVRRPRPEKAAVAAARREQDPPSVGRAIFRFMATSLVAMLVLALAAVYVQRRLGEEAAVKAARENASLIARGIVQPVLTDQSLAGPGADQTRLDRIVRSRVLSKDIVRVKIWQEDGRVLYSDEPRLMGGEYALDTDDVAVLHGGGIDSEISDLRKPENRFEGGNGRLLEVYLPVTVTPSGKKVLFEIYHRFDERTVSGLRLWRTSVPLLLGAIALVWLLQVPLVWSMARRLRAGHDERERLLRRAIESSTVERRRIASDLHDGVVPQLAGTAYLLGAARQNVGTAPMAETERALGDGAGGIREAIQQLRSLIIEIHPPNLERIGLAGALEELAAGVASAGLEVDVQVEPDLTVGPDGDRLLYRGAQEALRNVVAHAHASRATLVVTSDDGGALLVAADDGVGFTDADLARRRGEGHVGLGLLKELVTEVGGALDVASEPGVGTTLRLWVPGA